MVGEKAFRRYAWIATICFLLGTGFLGYKITSVRLDFDFEKFFPADDEETDFYIEFRERFNSENDFLLIAVERKAGIFNKSFLKEVDRLSGALESVDNVKHVLSITNQDEFFLFSNGQSSSRPYVNFDDFDAQRDSTGIYKNDELVNTLVAKNAKSLCIFLRHEDYLSKKKSDQLVNDINKLLEDYSFENVRIAGRTIQQKYYIDKMMIELTFFIGLSAFLIVVFLAIAFRSIWGVLIPQVIILSSMIWVAGGMGVFDTPFNIILTMLPTIMFVVAMSDVIHLVSRYLDALREEDKPLNAIMVAVKEVGVATFLTSVTTAIGFFSLYFVNVEPIQIFGIVMGCGVMIAFVLTFLMLPVLFYMFPGPKYVREKKKNHFWGKYLLIGFKAVMRRKVTILVVGGVIIALSVIGMLRIETNNYLLDDMRKSEQLKQDYNFLGEQYGGVRPFELIVTIKDSSLRVWDKEFLLTLDSVETYLVEKHGVNVKNSLVTTLKVINRSSHAGHVDYYTLPTSSKKIRRYRRNIRMVAKGEFVKTLVDSTEKFTHVSGSLPDIGNIAISRRNKALHAFLETKEMEGKVEYQLTGMAHLVDKNLKYLAMSLIRGLGISILIVALIMGIVYRSISILVISMVTNLIPLVVIAGVMGYLGVELKTSTSVIFTIAFGIAVDDTIHFLGKFKHELLKGKGKMYALKSSYMTTGKAMILTTLLLCAGFLLLMFSSFLGTFYLGFLLCVTLMVALIADITLLPVLLLLFYRPKQSKKALN